MTYFEAVAVLRKVIARDEQANEALDTLIQLHEVAQKQVYQTVARLENAKQRAGVAEAKLRECRNQGAWRKRGPKQTSKRNPKPPRSKGR
ncbi:MAG TPA: hypothetical protein ENN10_00660 [Actinobacteria bacterium]|nr:hypothetical protein [Actinomycetota bacterium]